MSLYRNYFRIFLVFLFFFCIKPVFACDIDNLMSPTSASPNVLTTYTTYGYVTNATHIWWYYGYIIDPNYTESNFTLDIPGWTCSPSYDCSGPAYTGYYTQTIDIISNQTWSSRLATDTNGQCAMGYQYIVSPSPTPTPASMFASNVKTPLNTSVASFSASAFSQLTGLIPLALIVLISVLLMYKGIHWFMEIASGKTSSFDEQLGSSFNSTSPSEFYLAGGSPDEDQLSTMGADEYTPEQLQEKADNARDAMRENGETGAYAPDKWSKQMFDTYAK